MLPQCASLDVSPDIPNERMEEHFSSVHTVFRIFRVLDVHFDEDNTDHFSGNSVTGIGKAAETVAG